MSRRFRGSQGRFGGDGIHPEAGGHRGVAPRGLAQFGGDGIHPEAGGHRGVAPRGLTQFLAAGGAAKIAYSALTRRPPGGQRPWSRTNHRGEPVTLLEGPAVAAGAVVTALGCSALGGPAPPGAAIALAGAGAAAFGTYDDLSGSGSRRGLRGHLGALLHGEVTTGAVKLGGIGATGLVSAALAGGLPADVAINAGLIAGGANLLNLFDLRPGRAIKVAAASSVLIAAGGGATGVAAPLGAALTLLPEDLGERAMLGDAGANALGAMLGAAAAGSLSRPARVALLAGIVALTGASEVVSFTKVIERTPPLRWLDMLGRRPAPPPVVIPVPRRDPDLVTIATSRSAENYSAENMDEREQ